MGLRTVVLKLHKPSKAKQKIIDGALVNYNEALRFLLHRAYPDLPELEKKFKGKGGQYNILAMSKWIDSDLSRELNRFDVQPFKDSLKVEFATSIANCLRLWKNGPRPIIPDVGKLRPVYFCRYDTKRSYCLLYDTQKDRYYAKLYLLNSANSRIVQDNPSYREGLIHIHKDNRRLEKGTRKEAYIVVPLSFGKWQEKFIKEASEHPECFKTARLFKCSNEYYLAVSIEAGKSEDIKTSAFMGVSRGLKSKLNYTVADLNGEILLSGKVDIKEISQSSAKVSINELHAAANSIADTAAAYKAQVIVQNLNGKGDRLSWLENGENRQSADYRWKDYNRLIRLLDYKLPWRCLPQPVKVSSVDIFYTCWNCGLNSRRNRLNKDLFICTSCGAAMDIDSLGSINLARKLVNYNSSKIKVRVSKLEKGMVFSNRILGLDCFISYNENQHEGLKKEIQKIIEGSRDENTSSSEKEQATRRSLVKKLQNASDFMCLIEYI